MKRPELLAPAGSLEKAKVALMYGADAVYFGAEDVSLRSESASFSASEVDDLVGFAHASGKRVYAAVNGLPRNKDLTIYQDRIDRLADAGVDALILASPALIEWTHARHLTPIHGSTQHGAANSVQIDWLRSLGASRVVLPRELSLSDIERLHRAVSTDLEVFIHGGLCSAVSGRCGLSHYLSDRDANRGMCAHSCRWNYRLRDSLGTGHDKNPFSLASKDLETLSMIPELIQAGAVSLKIEGRMKSVHYVATVVSAYRKMIDSVLKQASDSLDDLKAAIRRAENRETTHGFLAGDPGASGQITKKPKDVEGNDFLGIVAKEDEDSGLFWIDIRNKIVLHDRIEVFHIDGSTDRLIVDSMIDEAGLPVVVANVPKRLIGISTTCRLRPYDILRKVNTWNDPY